MKTPNVLLGEFLVSFTHINQQELPANEPLHAIGYGTASNAAAQLSVDFPGICDGDVLSVEVKDYWARVWTFDVVVEIKRRGTAQAIRTRSGGGAA